MKKYIIFLLLILVSCQPDEILLPNPEPIQEMIFDTDYSVVQNGQDISFKITTNEKHQLVIKNKNGSVIAKETFTPEIGINTRKLYTKSLPKESLLLELHQNNQILKSVSIIIE